MTGRFKLPIWTIPLVMAVLVALVGWWGNERMRDAIEADLKVELTTTLDANVTSLQIWATNQMRMATTLASEPTVHNVGLRILHAPLAMPNSPPSDDAGILGNYLRPRLFAMGYGVCQIVNTNLFVAANSLRTQFGVGLPVAEAHTDKFDELFDRNEPIIITPFKADLVAERRPLNADPDRRRDHGIFARRRGDVMLMQVAAPIRENGKVLGALALIINPTNEFSKVLSVAHRGETGETFAFDQTGLLISESRFDLQLHALGLLATTNVSSALNFRLHDPGVDLTKGYLTFPTNVVDDSLTHIVASAVEGNEGVDVVPSRDYRGVPVVGAWRWLPEFGIGVATEMEASEAFALVRLSQFVFLIIFLLLLLSATILFIFSYVNFASQRRLDEVESQLRQLGQYSLEEKIGSGSMGVVYRARHALMRRGTAVKLLLPELANETSIKRFEREVHLTCQLAHPNTIQIYDYGHTPDGVFYYAMELLTGLNLHQLVEEFGPQPEGRVINILTQICNSLAEAHGQQLVHRDIKPSNVIISDRAGVPDYVKVLDFGLVREYSATGELRDDHEMVGTPWFMSPEAIQNPAASDPRSDLYSVGGLAYYLLTAHHVFEHESAEEVIQDQLSRAPAPPSSVTTNPISAEMDAIILRCLEKNPDDRPQSALELAALLMTSPHAHDSTPEDRATWWQKFHARKNADAVPETTGDTTTLPDVKIDFDSRMES